MTKTATFLRKLDGFKGDARLYRVEPAMKYWKWEGQEREEAEVEYIVVSGINGIYRLTSDPETFIFPADESGMVVSWGELDGSFRGGVNHEQALANAGYSLTENGQERF